jgi:CHAD domain-containing protein
MVSPARPAPAAITADEIEWQFDAPDAGAAREALRQAAGPAGLSLRSMPAEQIVDVYFDSRDGRLRRAGWALRARTAGGRCEATLKSTSRSSRGPQRRREISEPVSATDAAALTAAPGPVGVRLRLLLGPATLERALTVRTRREHVEARGASCPIADVALDDTTLERAAPGAGADHLVRLEVESIGAADARLHDLAERLAACASLRRSEQSKVEAGLGGIAVPTSGASAPRPPLRPDTPVRALVRSTLTTQAGIFAANEMTARAGSDPEGVHRMRVASRRMREVVALFRDALPAATQALRSELGWARRSLGDMRDLDVQIAKLESEAAAADGGDALGPLIARLEREREDARGRMLAALDSARFEELLAALDAATAELDAGGPNGATEPGVGEGAPRALRRRMAQVRRRGDRLDAGSPDAELHALRIRVKRLRYALEFLAPLYPKAAAGLLPGLVELQDGLGRHQDAVIAARHLGGLSDADPNLPQRTRLALGDLAARRHAQAEPERTSIAAAYAAVRGKPWRRMKRALAADMD